MGINTIIDDFLKDVRLMQLATSRDNQPWLCSVWYVMDEARNVYWLSRKARRHSEEIDDNPKASCTFHGHYNQGFGIDKGQALVISGNVEILMGENCVQPYQLYTEKHPNMLDFQSLQDVKTDQGHHYMYKLTPNEIIWFDELNYADDPRQVVMG